MLEQLNALNDVKIHSCFEKEFESFGRIIHDYDFSEMSAYLEKHTPIPQSGNIYLPSDSGLEACALTATIQNEFFGGLPIQVGYCNGRNTTYNGMEYHKSSEISVAVTDFCVVLGHVWQIHDNEFHLGDETVFFIPKGTAYEMYATTLHLSPCTVTDAGFRNIVILPKGTNTPLEKKPAIRRGESVLLLQKNKWVLSHPDREPLMKQGAHPGFIGENKEIKYK